MMVLFGLLLLVGAALTGWRTLTFLRTARHATAVVVRESSDTLGDRSPAHPTVQFTTEQGRIVRAPQHSGGSAPYGRLMPVLYDPADPAGATAASPLSTWSGCLSLAWLGLVLAIAPFFGWRPALRR